jgi:hypothetical protein
MNMPSRVARPVFVEDGSRTPFLKIRGKASPFHGCAMHTIDSQGLEQQHRRLVLLEQQYGDRFHPDSGWN